MALTTPAATNSLRKQTLLGIAPVIAPRSEPPAGAAQPSTPPIAPAPPPPASSSPPSATATPAPHGDNPLRKQTLFGIAPVLPPNATSSAPPAAVDDERAAPMVDGEPAAPLPSSPPAGIASNSPFARDVPAASVAPPAASVVPSAVPSSTDHDLPALRPKRPRWLVPVAAAALIALGIVGLRRLDHSSVTASIPPAAAPAAPKPAAVVEKDPEAVAAPAPVPSARPVDEDDDAKPDPTTPDAEPLAPPPVAAAVRKVRVGSDPPGARLFWRGKEVGTTPFTLELQPGEKHSYELGLPGYVTRKVVIDGSKSEISIGMKPEAGVFTGASPRK
jgi:hypothetical protein